MQLESSVTCDYLHSSGKIYEDCCCQRDSCHVLCHEMRDCCGRHCDKVRTVMLKEFIPLIGLDLEKYEGGIGGNPSRPQNCDILLNAPSDIMDNPVLYSFLGMQEVTLSIDNVVCIGLRFVPDCIATFIKDKIDDVDNQKWPSKQTMNAILKRGFHIVPKSIQGSSRCNTWRISTSAAEMILFNDMTRLQRKIYLAFKTLFYGTVKVEGKYWITSYVAKTLFFQFLQNEWHSLMMLSPDKIIEHSLKSLFESLEHCFRVRACSNFFIPGSNVASWGEQQIPMLEKCIKKCIEVREDPLSYLEMLLSRFKAHIYVPVLGKFMQIWAHKDNKQLVKKALEECHNILSNYVSTERIREHEKDIKNFANAIKHYLKYLDGHYSTSLDDAKHLKYF